VRKNDEELALMFDVVVVSACFENSCLNRTC